MLMLKIMGNENAPDSDSRKCFRLIANLQSVQFYRSTNGDLDTGNPWAEVVSDNGIAYDIELMGNAYVLNQHGKTVASYGHQEIPETKLPEKGKPDIPEPPKNS